jgi:hypothetical protein
MTAPPRLNANGVAVGTGVSVNVGIKVSVWVGFHVDVSVGRISFTVDVVSTAAPVCAPLSDFGLSGINEHPVKTLSVLIITKNKKMLRFILNPSQNCLDYR